MATKKAPEVEVLTDEEVAAKRQLAKTYEAFPEIRDVDPAAVAERMGSRMRKATSLDELFDTLTGSTSNALVGRKFQFDHVAWQPYESDRGIIPNAIVSAVDLDTGEEEEFATTGTMLVEFLRQAQLLDAFPFKARIVGKKTRSGQTALNFERV